MFIERVRFSAAVLVAMGLALCATPGLSHSAVSSPLEGRTITGAKVASTDINAVMEYDPNLNLTWLRDWNYTGTPMEWSVAVHWASTLIIGAFTGWSLPSGGGGPSSGPLGYLYHDEGYTALTPGPFKNMQASTIYVLDGFWSGSEHPAYAGVAWWFSTAFGTYGTDAEVAKYFAVAVRPGDVAAAVPEPQTLALMLLGLGAVATALKRRPA